MSEMIERVARAICKEQQCDPDFLEPGDLPQIDGHKSNGDPAHFLWRDFVRDARAAIEAMREPTEAMSTHPMATCYNYGPYASKEVSRIWRSMIDAALSEKPQDITVACKCGWQGRQSELNGNLCPKCAAPFKAWP